MSLHVRMTADVDDEEHFRKGSKTMNGKNNDNTAIPSYPLDLASTHVAGPFHKLERLTAL